MGAHTNKIHQIFKGCRLCRRTHKNENMNIDFLHDFFDDFIDFIRKVMISKLFWLIWGTIFLFYGLEMEADILAQLTDVIQQSGVWDLVDKFIFFNFMQSFVYRTMKIITSIQNLTLSMGLNETAWIKMFVLTVVSSRVSIKNNFDI